MNSAHLIAPRVSYANLVGPFPPELVIDHKCRTPACVNPAHLRVVTPRVNSVENSTSFAARNFSKTHCPAGHPLTEGNIYVLSEHPTRRDCLTCRRERGAAWTALRRERSRLSGARGKHSERTTCSRGHPLSGENLYCAPKTGHRDCRICRADRSVKIAERRKAAARLTPRH